jgi:hypothetical protein
LNSSDIAAFAVHRLQEVISEKDPESLMLTIEQLAPSIVTAEAIVDGESIFAPDLMRSPGIAYQRGKLRSESELGASNLASYKSFPSDDASHLIKKPDRFIKWSNKVYRWVRTWTPEWHEYRGYRVTRAVKKAIDEGTLRIVP